MEKIILKLLIFLTFNFLLGCDLIKKKSEVDLSKNQEICKQITWQQIKKILNSNPEIAQGSDKLYSYMSYCQISPNESDELINIYRQTQSNEIRRNILYALNRNTDRNTELVQNNKKILDLYKSASASENRYLNKQAIEGLIKINQVDEILNVYNLQKEDRLRKLILNSINEVITQAEIIKNNKFNKELLNLYKTVAGSKNLSLSPVALRGILNIEGNEKWTDWNWSNEVGKILKEAVDKDFYKLSLLTYYELLALTNKYPDSQFTTACKEYTSFTEGAYFAQDYEGWGWGSDKQAVLRQPFNPPREIDFWPKFFKKYPGHPGSDDAMYRLARAYELQGDYETAILWYYKAYQAPDGLMSDIAQDRLLFIIDLLMSSDSVSKFLNKNLTHPLVPYLIYSRAIHLIRENKLATAQLELEKFLKDYTIFITQNKLTDYRGEIDFINYNFIEKIKHQIDLVKQLKEIKNNIRSDEVLYNEAAFLFHYEFIFYNHLWEGGLDGTLDRFMPDSWQGAITSIRRTVSYQAVKKANQGYELQNRHLRSIRLFQYLIKNYPNSELVDQAKYSIALNYYYLNGGQYPTLTDQKFSWQELAIKSYDDFVKEFPTSSMADDALLVIAELGTPNVAMQALVKLLNDYPNGDRNKEADYRLNKLKSQASSQTISASPKIGVGIRMEKLQTGNGVLIKETISNSPASQAGLQSGDIILQVDDQFVASPDDVANIVRRHQPGETVHFEIERQGQRLVVEVATALISL